MFDTRTAVELFHGQFNFTSAIVGNFAGTFIWHVNASFAGGGLGVGRSTDGAGKLWRAALGAVDIAPYGTLPCGGLTSLYKLELITP